MPASERYEKPKTPEKNETKEGGPSHRAGTSGLGNTTGSGQKASDASQGYPETCQADEFRLQQVYRQFGTYEALSEGGGGMDKPRKEWLSIIPRQRLCGGDGFVQ
ncbi:uncharacterized protein N7459_005591 [Penicillium hispanicum]|uniref:uncharacterized protein n=1 Tax=Penicillium hispanicum TaxID=1080232 RepID=UPI002542113A|nr:uncharacterized protein N7459_005591 [Penicillium hispanicum]KAJ5579606.1 hypothetical protein N7459_005591 [Penicillium hispanicum]